MTESVPMPFPCPICQVPASGQSGRDLSSAECPDCNNLLQLVRRKFPHQHNLSPQEIIWSASFMEDLGCDSLDTTELLMALEAEIGVTIFEDSPDHLKTVGDLMRVVRDAQRAAAA